jgi:ABC-type transport system involved in multi-copper enzyme maturation permease subunit
MFQIAWITLRRITEKSILVQFGILALVLIYVGLGLDSIIMTESVSSEQSGLGVGWLFLSIFTIFWSSVEIPREIDRKEVHVYLAKPITRFRYLLGKYFGMTGMVIAAEFFLMLVFTICLLIKKQPPSSGFYSGAARMALFLALLNAVCVAASMLLSEVKAMVTVLIVMAVGLLAVVLIVLAWSAYDPMPAALLAGAYHLLPDLLHYRWEPASGLGGYLGLLTMYTVGWSTICLLIAWRFFEYMDLP